MHLRTLLSVTLTFVAMVFVGCTFAPPTDAPDDAIVTDPSIRVTEPQPYTEITSPLTVRGEARGTWFFEATFPVVLVNWDGLIIAETYAEADGEWMTEDFVPFHAEVIFEKPSYNSRGTLILQRDNPSGLPEHDAAVEVPLTFR